MAGIPRDLTLQVILKGRRDMTVVSVAVLVAVQFAICAMLAAAVGRFVPPPTLIYLSMAVATLIIGGLALLFRMFWRMMRQGVDDPLPEAKRRILSLRPWPFVSLYLLAAVQMSLLTWAKTLLVSTGYWADPLLADVDSAMFGGDPIRLVQHFPIRSLVDLHYSLFLPWTLMAVWIALLTRRGVLAFFLTVALLGIGAAFLLPSGGPIFYERLGHGDRFADANIPMIARLSAEYLWTELQVDPIRFGEGISAMPSMHIALTAWAALVLGTFGKWQGIVGWLFCGMTWFGSVYLGWHYASDGLVGILAAIMIWRATNSSTISQSGATLTTR